jgi:hypothetical protein
MNKFICLLTIHGIGFEEPPHDGIPGYADGLHEHLSAHLGEPIFSGEPQRPEGPIYVQSFWPPGSNSMEPELSRLGNWDAKNRGIIDISNASLNECSSRIVHIALVYSHLEGTRPQLGPFFQLVTMGAFSLKHYVRARAMHIIHTLYSNILAIFKPQPQIQDNRSEKSSLRVRSDPGIWHAAGDPSGRISIIRQLENDVAAYVCRNDRRERVRSFVREALLRLAYRKDVAGIVINSHSNGTVIAFDILRELPPDAAEKVLGFITAGSPLLKYTDLFHWGYEVGSIQKIKPWMNFYDPNDPVADPLNPDMKRHRGTKDATSHQRRLYHFFDARKGKPCKVDIDDCMVDNITNSSGGGLQAHNYWDNDHDFIQPLVKFLEQQVESKFNQPIAS